MSAARSGQRHKVRKCFSICNTLGVLQLQSSLKQSFHAIAARMGLKLCYLQIGITVFVVCACIKTEIGGCGFSFRLAILHIFQRLALVAGCNYYCSLLAKYLKKPTSVLPAVRYIIQKKQSEINPTAWFVVPTGIEPVTQGFSVLCSTNWAMAPSRLNIDAIQWFTHSPFAPCFCLFVAV